MLLNLINNDQYSVVHRLKYHKICLYFNIEYLRRYIIINDNLAIRSKFEVFMSAFGIYTVHQVNTVFLETIGFLIVTNFQILINANKILSTYE